MPLRTQDGENMPKSLVLMKNHTLQQSHFSALPGPALLVGCPETYLQCILFLIPVQQLDAFPLYLTWSIPFYFLCLSLLSSL